MNSDGDVQTVVGTWNINGSASPSVNWLLFNGVNATAALTPGNSFTISGLVNTTGAIRNTTFNMATTNNRVTGSLVAPQIITVNQQA